MPSAASGSIQARRAGAAAGSLATFTALAGIGLASAALAQAPPAADAAAGADVFAQAQPTPGVRPGPAAPETPAIRAPDASTPLTDATRTTASPAEAPASGPPKMEGMKAEGARTDAQKTEALKTETPKSEAPNTEATGTQAPKSDATKSVTPQTPAPRTAAPQAEAPQTSAPQLAAPQTATPQPAAQKAPPPAARPPAGSAEAAASEGAGGETIDQAVCRLIETTAAKEGLPPAFLTRLIWRESSFRPNVVSHKGAQGIAQFMPGTARMRGLENPFDPQEAIPASGSLLADLNRQFGNLGLAAAAYNAGPGRVNGFLNGGGLPAETRTYVRLITGRPAEDWAALKRQGTPPPAFPGEGCLATVAALRKGAPPPDAEGFVGVSQLFAPWGVQISGNYSREIALAGFRRTAARYASVFGEMQPVIIATRMPGRGRKAFYRIRLPAQSRAEATDLCARLRKAGGPCIVLPN